MVEDICKSCIGQLNKRQRNPNENGKEYSNLKNKKEYSIQRYFSKEDIKMASKHMEICSISLIIREIQI